MSTNEPPNDVAAALAAVHEIDLTDINRKLQFEDPVLWTDETLAETEADYRRFLALNLLHPNESLVVNKILDDYWHQHILDTRKYAADCEKVFGFFLHHYPYFGINGDEDRQRNMEGFAYTQDLWEATFGESLAGESRLTLDKILGTYEPEPEGRQRERVYAFPQACKSGQHCNRSIVPNARINPRINPGIIINPQINPQINPAKINPTLKIT
jgi:hypothetical protein